jgi:hypothetical protein
MEENTIIEAFVRFRFASVVITTQYHRRINSKERLASVVTFWAIFIVLLFKFYFGA